MVHPYPTSRIIWSPQFLWGRVSYQIPHCLCAFISAPFEGLFLWAFNRKITIFRPWKIPLGQKKIPLFLVIFLGSHYHLSYVLILTTLLIIYWLEEDFQQHNPYRDFGSFQHLQETQVYGMQFCCHALKLTGRLGG